MFDMTTMTQNINNQPTTQDIMNVLLAVQAKQEQHYKGETITFEDLFYEWLNSKSIKNTRKTLTTKESFYRNHLQMPLGNLKLTEITQTHIESLVLRLLTNNYQPATIREILKTVLNQCFKYAAEKEYIPKNPCQYVSPPPMHKTHSRPMTNEEISAMWSVAKEDRVGKIALPLLLGTGMRRGELLGLEWSDIDFGNKTINVNKAWVMEGNKGSLRPPKTAGSVRIIIIPDDLCRLLKTYRENEGQGRTYVIGQTRSDKRIDPNNFDRAFNKWRDRAGVSKEIHTHCTRHTYCSTMNECGAQPVVLKNLTGHADTRMLDTVYIHHRDDTAQREAVKAFDGFLTDAMNL